MHPSRRSFLATITTTAIVTALAGCSDIGSPTDTDAPAEAPASPSTNSIPPTDAATPSPPDLDQREANVVAVSLEERNEGVRFSVTLHHDDAGEPGYANWWQVEALDGARLGRRDLRHPHERQPFTRSKTIEVPEEMACVVVRGHDETHGYGGRAMVVHTATGRTRPINQGSDPQPVPASACPS